jgi:hypothetical protein
MAVTYSGVKNLSVTLMDFEGEVGTSRFQYKYDISQPNNLIDADLNQLVLAYVGMSNAIVSSYRGQDEHYITRTPPAKAGNYPNMEDKATLKYSSVTGKVLGNQVPCPIDGLFESDTETVDSAAVTLTAFITALTTAGTNGTVFCDAGGNTIQGYYYGKRDRKPGRSEKAGRAKAIG